MGSRSARNDVAVGECTMHAHECGGGTGVYLMVQSSTVLVILDGKRDCLWGSFYLDAFGEEDIDLKRGKPLFLDEQRYRALEHQWMTHGFTRTPGGWMRASYGW